MSLWIFEENPLPVKSKMADYNSAANCSISLQFGTKLITCKLSFPSLQGR